MEITLKKKTCKELSPYGLKKNYSLGKKKGNYTLKKKKAKPRKNYRLFPLKGRKREKYNEKKSH